MYTDKGAKGAAGELITAAYYLARGYYVYRSEGQHAPFDLVVYKDGSCTRVEVKTAGICVYEQTGNRMISFPTPPKNADYDVLAVVVDDTVLIFDRNMSMSKIRDEVRKVVQAMPEKDHWTRQIKTTRTKGTYEPFRRNGLYAKEDED